MLSTADESKFYHDPLRFRLYHVAKTIVAYYEDEHKLDEVDREMMGTIMGFWSRSQKLIDELLVPQCAEHRRIIRPPYLLMYLLTYALGILKTILS
jgi:hypothetical protein